MKLFRFLALACLFVCFAVANAQYPIAWSSFGDAALPGIDNAHEILKAPSDGSYVYGDLFHVSQTLMRTDATGGVLWKRTAPGRAIDAAANDSGVVVLGSNFLTGSGLQISVTKFNTSGTLLWSKLLAGPSIGEGQVGMDSAGNVIACGTVGMGPEYDARVLKLSGATGDVLYTKTYGVQGVSDFGRAVVVNPDGSFFFGVDASYDAIGNVVLQKYDANGNLLWTKTNPGDDCRLTSIGDGNVVVTQHPGNSIGVLLKKYDSSGNTLWNTTATNVAQALYPTLAPSGSFYCLHFGQGGFALVKFDSTGTFAWSKTYAASINTDGAQELCIDAADNAYVSCGAIPYGTAVLLKFDSAGNFVWKQTAAGSASGSSLDNVGQSLMLDSASHLRWLASVANSAPTLGDFRLSILDTNGNSLSTGDLDTGRSDETFPASATDGAGNTYVTTRSNNGYGTYALMKFSPSGSLSWSRKIAAFVGFTPAILAPKLAPGGVIVAQAAHINGGILAAVYKYDVNGNVVWTFNNFPGNLYLYDFCVAGDGSVFLALASSTQQAQLVRVTKINANGTLAWNSDKPDLFGLQTPRTIVVNSSGETFVSYYDELSIGSLTWRVTKVSSAGVFGWTFAGYTVQQAVMGGMALDPAGNPVAIFPVQDEITQDISYVAEKINAATGDSAGSTPLFGGNLTISAGPVVIDLLGNVWTWTETSINNAFTQQHVEKINPDGSHAWTYHDVPGEISLLPDNAGGVFVGTTRYSTTGSDSLLFKLSANGQLAWPASGGAFSGSMIVFDIGGLDNDATTLSADTVGNLYFAGTGFGPNGTRDVNVTKYAALNSAFVAQVVPSTMTAGQSYYITSTFQNTGFETWTAALGYKLGIINSPTWGVVGVPLGNADSIAPGQSKKFGYYVYAPTTPGVYAYQTRMYKHGTSVGSLSLSAAVTVSSAANASRYVSQFEPGSVKAGTTFAIRVTMRNVGSTSWTPAGLYVLAPAAGYPTWGVSTIALAPADVINTGSDKAFIFNVTAPASPGTYDIRFQMKKGTTFFGDRTTLKSIVVTP